MLSRVIHEIRHLQRIHKVVLDEALGLTLREKLTRLNLQPALAELDSLTQHGRVAATSNSVPSATSHTRSAPRVLSWRTRGALPDPAALCYLLECLAYFNLGTSDVTSGAVRLAQAALPFMNTKQLAGTLAACCSLGQQDVTVSTLMLLEAALQSEHVVEERGASSILGDRTSSSPLSSSVLQRHTLRDGADILQLMEALHKARVEQEDVWTLLAEHCVRHIDRFDGRQLFRAIELFYYVNLRNYPDFFLAAERYISSQPSPFMSAEQIRQVMEYYRGLGQPVVALLNASTGRYSNSFESGLAAAAAALHSRDSRETPERSSSRSTRSTSAAAAVTQGASPRLTAATTTTTAAHNDPGGVVLHFVMTAAKTLAEAGKQELLDLLLICEGKRVVHPALVLAATARLRELYFTVTSKDNTHASAAGAADTGARAVSSELPLRALEGRPVVITGGYGALDVSLLTQTLKTLLQSDRPECFTAAAPAIRAMLDAVAPLVAQHYHPRLLLIANGVVTLLPPSEQPTVFFAALVQYLRAAKDLSTSESPQRLVLLAKVLLSLKAYNGWAVLGQFMPVITMAATGAPRRVQTELASCLAVLPAAKDDFMPAVLRAVTSTRNWGVSLTPVEVSLLLNAMIRSGVRHGPLTLGIVDFLRTRRQRFEPGELVRHLHSLALLGYREIELYSTVGEHLLAMTSSSRNPTTVHDLCLLLFVFSLVLKGVIRVVQQIMPRLKISASHASARDITLALYSLVKLQVSRHQDVTGPFCDRTAVIIDTFTSSELASTWSSLRALDYAHDGLLQATRSVLCAEAARPRLPGEDARASSVGRQQRHFRDEHFLSITAAVVSVSHQRHLQRGGVYQARSALSVTRVAGGAAASLAGGSPGEKGAVDELSNALVSDTVVHQQLQRVALRVLAAPKVSGLHVYLAATTMSRLPGVALSSAEWCMLAVRAEELHQRLSRGVGGAEDGTAAAEVLVALVQLHDKAVPALPGEEVTYRHYCLTCAEWGRMTDGTQVPLPPLLLQHVRHHLRSLLAVPSLKEALRQTRLLSLVSSNRALGGATISGDSSGLRSGDPTPLLTLRRVEGSIQKEATDDMMPGATREPAGLRSATAKGRAAGPTESLQSSRKKTRSRKKKV